jgi:hypothetical protein
MGNFELFIVCFFVVFVCLWQIVDQKHIVNIVNIVSSYNCDTKRKKKKREEERRKKRKNL